MTQIYVGPAVVDRNLYRATGGLSIEAESPAPLDGTLTSVNFWLIENASNVGVGMFQQLAAGVFWCRSWNDLGPFVTGYHEAVPVVLSCKAGDFIGFRTEGGRMEAQSSGGQGVWFQVNTTVAQGGYYSPGWNAGFASSISAEGTSYVAPPNEAEIYAALDDMLATYYPATAAWIRTHWDWEAGSLILALFVKTVLEGGGGGTVDLSSVLNAIGTYGGMTLHERHTTTQTLVGNTHTQVLDTQTDLEGAIGTANTDLVTAIGVSELHIIEHVDALQFDGITQAALDAAVASLKGPLGTNHDTILLALGALAVGETIKGLIDQALDKVGLVKSVVDAIKPLIDAISNGSQPVVTDLSPITTKLNDMDADLGNIWNKLQEEQAIAIKAYGGPASVTFGTPVSFTGSVTINASTNGVAGKMDGILFQVTAIPPTKGAQAAENVTNVKYLGWLVFQASDLMGDCLQWLGPTKRVYLPEQLTSPASVVICCRDGAQATATPFVFK